MSSVKHSIQAADIHDCCSYQSLNAVEVESETVLPLTLVDVLGATELQEVDVLSYSNVNAG